MDNLIFECGELQKREDLSWDRKLYLQTRVNIYTQIKDFFLEEFGDES